jgi:hypothetical protein
MTLNELVGVVVHPADDLFSKAPDGAPSLRPDAPAPRKHGRCGPAAGLLQDGPLASAGPASEAITPRTR